MLPVWINGWRLFAVIAGVITTFMLLRLESTDFSSPQDLSAMIQYSVRWAVPFIFLVIATSALFKLFPNHLTRWLLRNRRYLGLCFAVAMAWQGAFIFLVSFSHSAHYYGEIYLLRDELEGSSGYLFLVAMTLTSFGALRPSYSPRSSGAFCTLAASFFCGLTLSVFIGGMSSITRHSTGLTGFFTCWATPRLR